MCCIEDDNFSQDDSFLNYFLQKHKYPFSTTQKSGVIRTHYKWIGFPNGILKDQYARTGNSHSTISSVVTSTEDNLQAPGTTEIVYTSPGVNDMKLSEQTTSTEEAYVITNTSKDKGDLVTTESIQRNTINAENTNILTTPKVDKNRSTLLITNVTFYQNIAPEKAGILNNSTQNPIVKVNGEENSLIAPEEITTANSKDVSITNDSVDIDKVIASIFIRDSDAFTARPNLVQNQSDSAVGENISETQMQKIILENTTKSTQEDNTTEQVQTSTISTNIHPLTTTPAIVIPLYSLNANLEESILSEDNQFSIRSSSSQIERNDVQENLSQSEIDGGITIPKYAPVLENSTSLRSMFCSHLIQVSFDCFFFFFRM